MKNTMDGQPGALAAAGVLEKTMYSQRRKMFDAFMAFKGDAGDDSILDVIAGPAQPDRSPGYLSQWTDPRECSRIIACEIQLHHDVAKHKVRADGRYRHQPIDGRHLPFQDGEFDWVFCSEIIEHAGSFERQYELLNELVRVARKGVFVTTSNRWYPLEFNTALPFLHWLPSAWWRRILKLAGHGAMASGAALNLLGAGNLQQLASLLPCRGKVDVGHIRLFGLKAHFFLQIRNCPVR